MKTLRTLSVLFFAAAALCLTSCEKDPVVENFPPSQEHNWSEEMDDTFGDTFGK